MIDRIQIRNFQSLVDADITLGKLTVITGHTNAGKTAFMRAIQAAVENWRGESFITDGAEFCAVGIVGSRDGKPYSVVWQKSRGMSAHYFVDNADSDEYTFALYSGLYSVELSKGVEILPNFQPQLTLPFLISQSDSYKSKVFGEITNANIIFLINQQIKRQLSDVRSVIASTERWLADVNAKIEDARFEPLHWLDNALTLLDQELSDLRNRLRDLDALEEAEKRLCQASVELEYLQRIDSVLLNNQELIRACFRVVKASERDIDILQKCVEYDRQIMVEVGLAKVALRKKEILELALPDIFILESSLKDLVFLRTYEQQLVSVANDLPMNDIALHDLENAVQDANIEYNEARASAKVCPLCESVLL